VELEGNSDGNPVDLFIAVEDPHHLMRMSAQGTEESGDLTLTEWDQPVDAEVPGKSEIFVQPSD
jgi:hypothetical protein